MKVFKDIESWQIHRKHLGSGTLGFVPTMGALHEGHLSLVKRAKLENTCTVLSIFVNPTQFNQEEDFLHYPRVLEADLAMAEKAGVDFVLLPEVSMLYPDEYRYQVHETMLSQRLEGEYRPGHFTGMLTVVLKLLMLVRPTRLYIGQKDWQQSQLIQEMIQAFFLEVECVVCPIVREAGGLAMSSRNRRLSPELRELVTLFPQYLLTAKSAAEARRLLEQAGLQVDYVVDEQGHRLGAVTVGGIRLIDCMPIGNRRTA